MESHGEFIVSQADILKIRAIELGLPMYDQVPLKAIVDGAAVVVLDGMGDPKGTPVFTCQATGESVGEPVMLAVQNHEIGVSFTNGLGFVNMIHLAPPADGRIVPAIAEAIVAGSAAVSLASSTADGAKWVTQEEKDEFAASASGLVPGDLALPKDPEGNDIPGAWSLFPSVGSVAADGSCTVSLLFKPEDESKFAPLVVVVPIDKSDVTDKRAIEVTPVTDFAQLTEANTNGIAIEVPAEKLSLGLTWTGDSTAPVVSDETVTQTVIATAGTPVEVSEADIQALGYTGLSGTRSLVAMLIEVPAGSDTIVVTDTVSGGIGIASTQNIKLSKSNILNGHLCHLLTPVSATNNVVERNIKFKAGDDVLREHVLSIDVSALLS